MPTTITVHITKDVLEATKNCETNRRSTNCAISYAIRSLFPEARTARKVIFYDSGFKYESELPLEAQYFITQFDMSTPFERERMIPVSFNIYVPDDVINAIDISEVHRILKESKTLSLVQ